MPGTAVQVWSAGSGNAGRILILQKVQLHRFGRNAGFIRQDVKSRGSLPSR